MTLFYFEDGNLAATKLNRRRQPNFDLRTLCPHPGNRLEGPWLCVPTFLWVCLFHHRTTELSATRHRLFRSIKKYFLLFNIPGCRGESPCSPCPAGVRRTGGAGTGLSLRNSPKKRRVPNIFASLYNNTYRLICQQARCLRQGWRFILVAILANTLLLAPIRAYKRHGTVALRAERPYPARCGLRPVRVTGRRPGSPNHFGARRAFYRHGTRQTGQKIKMRRP
jgi:hypothetical protein